MLKNNDINWIYQIIYLFIFFLFMDGQIFDIPHIHKLNYAMHAQHVCNGHVRQLFKKRLDLIHYLLLFRWLPPKQYDNVIAKSDKWFCNIIYA